MPFPKGTELVKVFLEGIESYPEFQVQNNTNPLKLTFNGRSFMLFFKCISYAGNPYPKNTTRAQLPRRPEFDNLNSSDLFLFLGYDTVNDLYVCWDPVKTKARLNQKAYVSFFCRKSLQDSVVEGEIKNGRLTNGDEYVLFKRSDISSFFEMLELHFPQIGDTKTRAGIVSIPIKAIEPVEGFLDDIGEDSGVKLFVDQLYSNNKTKLFIVSECMNEYGSYYYRMRFIDWANIINKYITNLTVNDA